MVPAGRPERGGKDVLYRDRTRGQIDFVRIHQQLRYRGAAATRPRPQKAARIRVAARQPVRHARPGRARAAGFPDKLSEMRPAGLAVLDSENDRPAAARLRSLWVSRILGMLALGARGSARDGRAARTDSPCREFDGTGATPTTSIRRPVPYGRSDHSDSSTRPEVRNHANSYPSP